MAYYDDDIAGALEDIQEAGELCKWRHYSDAAGGTAAKPADRPYVDYDVYMVFLPAEGRGASSKMSQSREPETEVKGGGVMALMGQVPFTPTTTDRVTRASGEILTIRLDNGIDRLAPNGQSILYYVFFER